MVAVAGLFTACDEDGYWDKYHFEDDTYSFEHSSHSYSLKATDAFGEAKIVVVRGTTKGNVDVPTIITANSSIITAADNVAHFADGSSTAEITLNIDESKIVIGANYKVEVTLDVPEESLSISGATTYTLTFVKDYNWVSAGSGVYASSFTGEQFAVKFEMAEGYNDAEGLRAGYYRMAPYKAGYYIPFYLDADANPVDCPVGMYNVGVTYAGAALEFFHNPGHSAYGSYCYFTKEGSIYLLAGLWNTAEGLYTAKEQFMWTEGGPAAE